MAQWYDRLVGDEGSDYHRNVILPAVIRLLDPRPSDRLLDLCCGQGVLTRFLIDKGLHHILAVDASPQLIAAAQSRGSCPVGVRFVVSDACRPASWADGTFDAAACILAIHDLENLDGLFANLARAMKSDGRAVVVLMHPCFRIPRQSHWGWDEDKKIQYRRMDRYVTSMAIPVTTHPGKKSGEQTLFYHRPLGEYLNALRRVGLVVAGAEELVSHRRSQPGSRSRGEHRSAAEFPVFLALRVIKHPSG